MHNELSADLAPFKGIILSLVSYANHHKLDTLIEKLTPNVKHAVRFLIKMEIKRIAKPCTLVMDFRSMFSHCEPVQHNEQCHYLDKTSKKAFLQSIKQNQDNFCVYMYNELTEQAKHRYQAKQAQRNDETQSVKSSLNVAVANAINLSNQNYFHEEPESFHSQYKVFTYDPLGMSDNGKRSIGITVTLTELTLNQCVLKSAINIPDIVNDELFLWFYQHDERLEFEPEITLAYKVIKQEQQQGHYIYQLSLANQNTNDMLSLLSRLQQQKHIANEPYRQKQVEPLIDSVMAKSHEQFLTSRINDIPLMCAKFTSGWRPDSGLYTQANKQLWQFFTHDDDLAPFSRLFGYDKIQQALENNQSFDDYAYILKHQYADKTQFLVIWQQQLEQDNKARKLLQKHFLNGDYRYIRLTINTVNALEDAYLPSAVASSMSSAMAFMNRPLCKATAKSLKAYNHLAVIADITELNNTLSIAEQLKVKEQPLHEVAAIKCSKEFVMPRLQHKSQMKKIRLDLNDARREERFDLTLDVVVTRYGSQPCKIKGKTNNISSRGLSINLTEPLKYKAGENIALTLRVPDDICQPEKLISLDNQAYQLLGGGDTQLRLVINGLERKHQACQYLRKLIFHHLDDLKLSGAKPNEIYGMSKALRNIYAKNHLSVPFFIHQDKRQWYINSFALSDNSQFPSLGNGDACAQEMLIKLINQEKFRDYCLLKLNKIAKKEDFNVFYMVTVPHDNNQDSDKLFWLGDLEQLQQSGKLNDIMKKIYSLGRPTVLRVQISKPQGIFAKGFIDELHYLRKISPNNANELIQTIEQVSGIGEVTDHTEQVLALYNSYFAKKSQQSLAKVS